jgi:hypothetical protein
MNKGKYLNKIKKLLNLARKSTNENEVALALRQAQKLMEQHQISEADATFIDITQASSKGAPSNAQSIPRYMAFLGDVVCRAFGVKCMYEWRYQGNPRRCATFYGPSERPQVAAYVFDVLSRQMMAGHRVFVSSLRKNLKPATKIARADTFCEAWVQGAYQAINDFAVTEPEQTLMESYREHLRKTSGLQDGQSREPKSCRGGADSAASQGFSAGKKAELLHSVNGKSTETNLIGSA